MRIYGRLQNAKRKRRPVNAILHALLMIASRLKKNVKRHARFALQPRQHVQIYGRLQNAKRKIMLVNVILHALLMIASRPRQTAKRNARFARPNMNNFTMLSSF